jgi:hypothetical protein
MGQLQHAFKFAGCKTRSALDLAHASASQNFRCREIERHRRRMGFKIVLDRCLLVSRRAASVIQRILMILKDRARGHEGIDCLLSFFSQVPQFGATYSG